MSHLIRVIAAATITAGAIAAVPVAISASPAHAVAHDTWTSPPAAVSWG